MFWSAIEGSAVLFAECVADAIGMKRTLKLADEHSLGRAVIIRSFPQGQVAQLVKNAGVLYKVLDHTDNMDGGRLVMEVTQETSIEKVREWKKTFSAKTDRIHKELESDAGPIPYIEEMKLLAQNLQKLLAAKNVMVESIVILQQFGELVRHLRSLNMIGQSVDLVGRIKIIRQALLCLDVIADEVNLFTANGTQAFLDAIISNGIGLVKSIAPSLYPRAKE